MSFVDRLTWAARRRPASTTAAQPLKLQLPEPTFVDPRRCGPVGQLMRWLGTAVDRADEWVAELRRVEDD